jgi:hypothetical protein
VPQHREVRNVRRQRTVSPPVRPPQRRDARLRAGPPGHAGALSRARTAGPDSRRHGPLFVRDGGHADRHGRHVRIGPATAPGA